ncbi:ead/Ea22-like family protein [Streptomyces sp. NPDC090798]|uniref:ead/Ea22-like family protein n=1 Tax=Streptomyces sp. NPDC090798 TaxID=3365968 RepID=UPI00380F7398
MTAPADELRTAAQTLRQRAEAATPGPWRQHDTHLGQYGYAATVLSGEGNDTDLRAWLPSMSQEPWDETRNAWPDAAYIAAMGPGVGLALADWLDVAAEHCRGHYLCCDNGPCPESAKPALAVARQINGGEQR